MTIPTDILAAVLTALLSGITGLQIWILVEIIRIKVRLANYEETRKQVQRHERRLNRVEAHCQIQELA